MNRPDKYLGIILAAGTGSRIQPLSLSFPKPLLPICNKPIIQYQIEIMIRLGIKRIFIVCGHLKGNLQNRFRDGRDLGVTIQYIDQERPLGIAHALARVEPYADRPFLLFLGDIFFVTRNMEEILHIFENRRACGVLAVKQESRPEYIKRNYAVLLHESGMVKRVVEKPRYISNNLKGCGIYFFDLPIFDAVRRTPRTAMRDEYEITSSIQILIDDGYPVFPAEAIEWDMNITTVNDLILSNLKMLDLLDREREIGANVRHHPETRIIHSVIGPNTVIEHPITIRDSVIMPETIVSSKSDLENVLVMNDRIIAFGNG
ncbi:MAG: sugar phosphate nucleotidyltransferase [Thermodesulfobacteriota bacterium]|nr:sugar phosphate nucleotidyltransferase [Thermodesulfobacteriota bacterium]